MSLPQNEGAPLLEAASAALRLAGIDHSACLLDHGNQVAFTLNAEGKRHAARFPADGNVVKIMAWAKEWLSQ